ncbi:lipase modulator protein [Minicystis rosea]|nr:lipase modulator protein [Minicystis rosea]
MVRAVNVVTTAAPMEEPLPGSLQGTIEDGALREDAAGDLVIGPEVLRLFDYYLSTTGEESAAAIRKRIEAAIHRKLGEGRAAKTAIDLLNRYLGYREGSRGMAATGEDLGGRLDALKQLRRAHFGDFADKLFGEEEQAAAVAVAQHRVHQDDSLSAADRERRLSELEARLPETVREARAAALEPMREAAEEASMRAAGASDADVHAYRVATVGDEAADRLAALDAERAAWKARLTAFREARAALEQSEPDPGRRSAAIQRLLDRSFSPTEQIRVEAADRRDAEAR